MASIGILGMGMMGSAMALNLLSRNHEVHVYNRAREKTSRLVEKGAVSHPTPKELGHDVEIAITMVTDHNAVEEIALGPDGLLNGIRKGGLWIDMSTIDPEASVRHARECYSRGIKRLDAPVVGGPKLAAQGGLLILVGGDRDTYEAHEQLLRQIGKDIVHLGEDGSGHKMKVALNLYLALTTLAFSEALTFAQKLGFEAKTFVDTLNRTHWKSGFTETKGGNVARGDFTPTFTLGMMLKDLLLADEQARKHRMALPVTGIARQLYSAASTQGLSELDYSALTLLIQKLNGLDSAKLMQG